MIRYGAVTNNIYGIVILINLTNPLAPSTSAASYNSIGIFCNIPVTCRIVYGIPIHRFTTITVILAQVAFVKNGSDFVIHPAFFKTTFIIPSCASMLLTIRSETNCGIAIESININLQKALNFVPFLLISSATSIPNM